MAKIGDQMKALTLEKNVVDPRQAIASLKFTDKPIPQPKHGQVLVRMEAASCNPSDVMNLQGTYGATKMLPATPGAEGCGTVVQSGGGFTARRLVGKRVACGLQADADGTWAEYFVAEAATCIPIKRGISAEQTASLVSQFTALGLIDTLKAEGHRAFVHAAGPSQVGRMILGLEKKERLTGIHLVRRQTQIPEMQALGAKHVLSLENAFWREELKSLCERLHVSAAIDAIGGDTTGALLSALPSNGVVWLYGALALKSCGEIAPLDIIFRSKRLEGFYLGNWLRAKNLFQLRATGNRVQALIREGIFETPIREKVALAHVPNSLAAHLQNMSGGKILICPAI